MQILIRLSLVLMSPVLAVVYWRNSSKKLGDLHAQYELTYE